MKEKERAFIYLVHEPSTFDQSLVPGIWVGVVHHESTGVHCKAEPHMHHGLNVHHFVL